MDANRREGVAIILESSRELERDGDGWFLQDLGLNLYERRRYEFALDVRVPGIEPYTVRDSFRVPRRVENTGFFSRPSMLREGRGLGERARPRHRGLEAEFAAELPCAGRRLLVEGGPDGVEPRSRTMRS